MAVLRRVVGILAVLLLLVGAAAFTAADRGGDGQRMSFLFPNAANLIDGSEVEVSGLVAGEVTGVTLRDGLAQVDVALDEGTRPLTSGTTARIEYRALLGERIVQIVPGEADAAPLPDGAVVEGNLPRVELDDVLNAMTPEVRADLQGLLEQSAATLDGYEADVNATLEQAGPAVDALGEVLAAIGRDGEALEALVGQAAELSERVVARRGDVADVLDGLEASFGALAARDADLAAVLDELPSTLDQAGTTLGELDPTVDEVLPVLRDLRPVTQRLPGVAERLAPVLTDLRPTVAELRELLPVADDLLAVTPGLFDDVTTTLPDVDEALAGALPAVDTLRPYTPEVIGFMTNWAGFWRQYDANGRYARVWVNQGTGSFLETPTQVSGVPALTDQGNRPAGDLVGQPWTDAAGSTMR